MLQTLATCQALTSSTKTLKAQASSLKAGRLNLSKEDRGKSARMHPHQPKGRGMSSGKFVSAFHIGTSGASSSGAAPFFFMEAVNV
jgi:hypothetical protein